VRLALEGNTFRKIAGTTAGDYSPIQNTRSDTIIDSMTPNTFCNEGTSTTDGQFVAPFVTGALAAASTWNPSSQIGVSNCP
jgi:hypothetical protein